MDAAEGMLGSAGGVSVRLENQSVWSRFHGLGTEMILTERGRRMFPCCRFLLTGLRPGLSYLLILDIAPVDDRQHRWTGESWEPDGAGDALLQSPAGLTGLKIDHERIPRVCVHPDSPAPGQRWMDGPVSFYKLKLSHRPEDRDSALVLRPMRRYQPRLCVVPVGPEPDLHVFTFPETAFYTVTSYQNPLMTRLKIDCNPFMLAFREDGPSARLIQNKLKLALTAADRQKHRSWTHTHQGSESSEEGRKPVRDDSVVSSLAAGSGVSRGVKRVYRRGWRSGARKAKAKWWTNVKHRSAAVSSASDTASMQPDLEQVDGLLFVSFTAKEALDLHVGKMRSSTSSRAEKPAPEAGWFSEQEMILLQQLQQMKNRQIIHPALQEVGLKLNLLDPTAPIDLHYLGVALPLPPSVVSSSSRDASGCVSGKARDQDLNRIKGWMEKFRSKSSTDSSGHSAFSSELLDEYLEAEGQRITERAAVFSSSAPSPVLYQLPVKSSSYVKTLDSVLQTKRDKRTKAWRCVRRTPEASSHSSTGRHRWKHSVSADVPQQRPAPSRRRGRYRRRRPTLRFNRDAVDGAQPSSSPPEQAVSLGQSPTHISSERAGFALSSLLTAAERARETRPVRAAPCVKDFCRLGCVCESLKRGAAGPVHCRRVQCMFSCSCFRHRIILVRSRRLQAFPVTGPGSDDRPEPAVRVSSLWQRRAGEMDPEPLFTPRASRAPLLRRGPRCQTPGPRPQVPEAEKDPVYLYLESMMTCARVREYNSNPPLQVHLLPAKRSAPEHTVSGVSQLGLSASQSPGEEPTKVLEIISGCNWETHRSLVLKELFRCVSMNLLAPLSYIDVYQVELLSKDLRKDERGSTLIYKVCVSLGQTPDKTREPRRSGKKPERGSSSQKVHRANGKERQDVSNTPPEKHFPLLSRVVPAGLLRADKKDPVRSGPIKVNGKTYAQAKLILGRMGALHPANRLAAYVTGRIKPLPPNTSQALSRALKETRSSNSKHTVSQANQSKEAFKRPIPRSPAMPRAPKNMRRTNPGRGLNVVAPPLSSGLVPVAPPLSGVETVLPASSLPPGQQVVLQPVAGMSGVNVCQFNGQMIQLVPITAAVPVQVQPGGSGGASSQGTSSVPAAASQNTSSKPLPLIVPRIHGVQGNAGFTFGRGSSGSTERFARESRHVFLQNMPTFRREQNRGPRADRKYSRVNRNRFHTVTSWRI
ncbi:MAX gene-associated protein [Puntigrus tetrazona]|uniref:MAX gene-associated protein n=1 Tax=Puntigrus tetrazona TaxID=1606681 RepID=UPI001C8AD89A|nr:MAX gene-associated protein [Puntigrus tetrazona]